MVDFDGLLDKNRFNIEIDTVHEVEKKLGYSIYNNATLLPCVDLPSGKSGGGIIDSNGNFLKESTVHNGSHIPYQVNSKDIHYSDETVIFFGMLIGIWGHCISDCIKRAWFFDTDIFKEKYKDVKVVYVAPKGTLHGNFVDLLKKLNIEIENFTEIKNITKFKKIIVPDSSFFLDDFGIEHFTCEYRFCIDKIKRTYIKQKEEVNKKIYYSHRDVRGFNNDIGEQKLERFFQKNGFEIIHPEKMNLDAQLDLLSTCSVFASSDGSTSHNSIFLPETAEVIIIPRSPYLTFHQLALNELYGLQNIFYIDASLSILCKGDRPTRGPFFYYVSEKLIEHVEKTNFTENEEWIRANFYDFEKYFKCGFYLEKNRVFTAYSPYTELALYYYNQYLYLKKRRMFFVFFKRFALKNMKRIKRKVLNLL